MSVLGIAPQPKTREALEAATREEILKQQDEAIYKRRNFAIEQEEQAIENETQRSIADTKAYEIGVNPDPSRWDGVVLPFSAKDLSWLLPMLCETNDELGQSGWYKSIVAQINGAARFLEMEKREYEAIDWGDRELSFAVREPYPSVSTGADIVMGKIKYGESLKLRSNMPEKGVIFSDGIEDDYIEFNSGTEVTITVAEKQGNLLMHF